jgi:hypothetical protein
MLLVLIDINGKAGLTQLRALIEINDRLKATRKFVSSVKSGTGCHIADAGDQTPSDGIKQRILYFGPPLISSLNTYQTIASPTGFAVLITASDGIGYHSPSMGTQY